jgi:adenosine kinase
VHHTGRFICTTDADQNQIATFYPGAMGEDKDIDLRELPGPIDLVLVGASDPEAMIGFTRQCREAGIPFAADTSQQLARADSAQVRDLMDGAAYLFSNEYEAHLTEQKTGWSADEVTARVGVRVTTLGKGGARIDRAGEEAVLVGPILDAEPREPTGAGDGFRAGFLAAVAWGFGLERSVQLGNMIAVHALESVGPQEYELKPAPLADRFEAAYGPEAAEELVAHYA